MSRFPILLLAAPLWALPLSPQPSLAQQEQSAEAAAQPQAAQGPSSGISCVVRDGVPVTASQTKRGEVPIIRWTSGDFDASGWTAEKRCQIVSQRFETFRSNGQLKYLTTGRVGGQPVICAVRSDGAPCTGGDVLYTLKPGQDAGATLQRLLNVRRGVSGPISETTRRVYLSFDRLIEDKLAARQGVAPERSAQPRSAPRTMTPDAAAPF